MGINFKFPGQKMGETDLPVWFVILLYVMIIRDGQHRTIKGLSIAPFRADLGNNIQLCLLPLTDQVTDHGPGDQHDQDQQTNDD